MESWAELARVPFFSNMGLEHTNCREDMAAAVVEEYSDAILVIWEWCSRVTDSPRSWGCPFIDTNDEGVYFACVICVSHRCP